LFEYSTSKGTLFIIEFDIFVIFAAFVEFVEVFEELPVIVEFFLI